MSPPSRAPKNVRVQQASRKSEKNRTRGLPLHHHDRQAVKKGRPPKLTRSEQRKLARLYTCTQLSTKDICETLKRLNGKTISVRCAQNNIKEVLHSNCLTAVRPKDRIECRLRISLTPRYQETENARRRCDRRGSPKELADRRSPLQLSTRGGLIREPRRDELLESSSNRAPQNISRIDDAIVSESLGTAETASPLSVGASSSRSHGCNYDAVTMEGNAFHGFQSFQMGSPESHESTAGPKFSERGCKIVNTGPVTLSTPGTPPPSSPGCPSHEVFEQAWDELMRRRSIDIGDTVPSLQDFDRVGEDMWIEPLFPDSFVDPQDVIRPYQPPQLQSQPILLRSAEESPSSPFKALSEMESIPGLNTGDMGPRRRKSWSPSLGSLRKRLSYSSSQFSDVMSVFKHLSFSSRETKWSSGTVSELGQLDEVLLWNGPEEVPIETVYTTKHPVQYVFNIDAGTSTTSEWCNKCFGVLYGSYCTTCSRVTQVNPFIQDSLGASRLRVPPLDRSNHTALHVAAAIGADQRFLKALLKRGGDLNAVNTAGQTFMHVMDPRNLPICESDLPALLSLLSQSGFDFGKVDIQGVNVLQALLQYELHHVTVERMFQALGGQMSLLASRDNLGRTWQSTLLFLGQEVKDRDPERAKALSELVWKSSGEAAFNFLGNLAFNEAPLAVSDKDYGQFDLVIRALSDPGVEDFYGRNGIHCLAGALFPPSNTRISHKELLSKHRELRQSYLTRLLEVGVSVNAYDKAGDTPLTAFLQSKRVRAEGKNDDGEVEIYLKRLVNAGACVNSRTRSGESALHLAVKLGIISATRTLIKMGANLHARQKDGKGVVTLGLETAQSMKGRIRQRIKLHKALHIRIMTCVSLARSRRAVNNPSNTQEWDAAPTSEVDNDELSKAAFYFPEDVEPRGEQSTIPPYTAECRGGYF